MVTMHKQQNTTVDITHKTQRLIAILTQSTIKETTTSHGKVTGHQSALTVVTHQLLTTLVTMQQQVLHTRNQHVLTAHHHTQHKRQARLAHTVHVITHHLIQQLQRLHVQYQEVDQVRTYTL